MPKITLTLERNDLSQIIDGLTQRMEAYHHTAAFLDDEDLNLEHAIIEEVRDSTEAKTLANNYNRIIQEITRQL